MRRKTSSILVRALPVACGAIALCILAGALRLTGEGREPTVALDEGARRQEQAQKEQGADADRKGEDAGADEGPAGDEDEWVDGAQAAIDRARELVEGEARTSTPESFLDDLNQGAPADGDRDDRTGVVGVLSVQWKVREDIPKATEPVLNAYAERGGAHLLASGYLDLRGNIWGAVIRADVAQGANSASGEAATGGSRDSGSLDAWCDVVLVSTDDGAESTVRIARMHA